MADDDDESMGDFSAGPINARIMAREMAEDEENEAMEEWEALGNDPDDFTMAVRARAGAVARASRATASARGVRPFAPRASRSATVPRSGT